MDFDTAIDSMVEKSLGECGESYTEMEVAKAILKGIEELREAVKNA